MASPAKGSTKIGQPGESVFAIAFRGGGLDSVLDLGVIHALLVSRRRPPHVVAGSSAGAVSAAALAEVLQESNDDLRVARLRQFLDAYIEAPHDLGRSLLPDTNEVRAETPLRSIDLPIYPRKEREEREQSVRTEFGLIRLINDVLSLHLRVSDITRFANLVLLWNATGNIQQWWIRWWKRLALAVSLWCFALTTLWRVMPISWRLLRGRLDPVRVGVPIEEADRVVRFVQRRFLSHQQDASIIIRSLYQRMRATGRLLAHAVGGGASYALLLTIFPVSFLCWISTAVSLWKVNQGEACKICEVFAAPLGTTLTLFMLGIASFIFLLIWLVLTIPGLRRSEFERMARGLLQQYGLDRELGSSYFVKQRLVNLFDRNYYGKANIDEIAARALEQTAGTQRDVSGTSGSEPERKTLDQYYDSRKPPIHVTPIVTNLCDGEAVTVAPEESVVRALLGALAVVPMFKPVPLLTRSNRGERNSAEAVPCVDALNVINEPILALIDYLRWHLDDNVRGVYIYPVASFPAGAATIPAQGRYFDGLVQVVQRVLELRRYQSALLERGLVKSYKRLMPTKGAIHEVSPTERFVAAELISIEPTVPLRTHEAWLLAETPEKKRDEILKAVATGCRTTLRAAFGREIAHRRGSGAVNCRKTLGKFLENGERPGIPGSRPGSGPGLSEVCEVCIWHDGKKERKQAIPSPSREEAASWPIWPHRRLDAPIDSVAAPRPHAAKRGSVLGTKHSSRLSTGDGPWVTLLFSGGVFRGVFQVGVLNGLVQVGATPRVYAGSSVGSIMAAMASRIFAIPSGSQKRQIEVVRLAATFLGLDRLILTDRFADLVRRFTLRAGLTHVSLRDLDHVFRLYDMRTSEAFAANLRQVLAGFERVLYQTPYDVEQITRAIREQQYANVYQLLGEAVEDLLTGYGIGLELLGTEPMQTLIRGHVLPDDGYGAETIAKLNRRDQYFLITTTNLTLGMLEIITNDHKGTPLVEALLASSAFPAVFRPRRSSEVMPQEKMVAQFVDGGVMDNLPLRAVTDFLEKEAVKYGLVPQHDPPHLLITGSLEPPPPVLNIANERDKQRLREISDNWVLVTRRIKELRFNKKVDAFAEAHHEIQAIWTKWRHGQAPVSLRVATVKPRWLCGTFAFHPMLGFRQDEQARSIAHGCAATLATLASLPPEEQAGYESCQTFRLQVDKEAVRNWSSSGELLPQQNRSGGACWFQENGKKDGRKPNLCPFSEEGLKAIHENDEIKIAALKKIYRFCGKKETHQRRTSLYEQE